MTIISEKNYIPVDFPLYEDIWNKIIVNKEKNPFNPDQRKEFHNRTGFRLAQKKFQKLKDSKTAKKFREQNGDDWYNMKKDGEFEYQIFFVKGSKPIYRLEFHNHEA